MKKEKKTESRLKLKFSSANSAIAKARAFFRSFNLKHRHHRHEQPPVPSSSTTTAINTSFSLNENNQKEDLILNSISPITNISISTIPRVDKINPRDMIVHRIMERDNKLSSNYFQQKYKQYLKPSLLLPKQYYNDLLNKQNYSTFINEYDFYSQSPVLTLSPNFRYLPTHNHIPSPTYRPFIYNEIKSFPNEHHPIIRSSPSPSMLTWNQCVRRLNIEYRLTIDALEQAKEYLKEIYSNSKDPMNKNLFNNETKKSTNVTFCLPSSSSISKNSIEQQIVPSIKFSKPKLIKPLELNKFIPSSLESELSIVENNEKFDSIADIIKKFNDLNRSLSTINKEEQQQQQLNSNSRVHFKPSITTYEIPSSDCQQQQQQEEDDDEETTTYTIETIYKNDLLIPINKNLIVVQENTTVEQFNSAQIPSPNNSVLLKNSKKSYSRIPTSTNNISRLKQSSKINSSINKLKSPSTTVNNPIENSKIKKQSLNNTNRIDSPICSNRVKTMVHQFNTTTTSSMANKRISRPSSIKLTTSSMK